MTMETTSGSLHIRPLVATQTIIIIYIQKMNENRQLQKRKKNEIYRFNLGSRSTTLTLHKSSGPRTMTLKGGREKKCITCFNKMSTRMDIPTTSGDFAVTPRT